MYIYSSYHSTAAYASFLQSVRQTATATAAAPLLDSDSEGIEDVVAGREKHPGPHSRSQSSAPLPTTSAAAGATESGKVGTHQAPKTRYHIIAEEKTESYIPTEGAGLRECVVKGKGRRCWGPVALRPRNHLPNLAIPHQSSTSELNRVCRRLIYTSCPLCVSQATGRRGVKDTPEETRLVVVWCNVYGTRFRI